MAYVSLYRKYRPQSFAEVVGQTHVTRTLANAIAEDRLHHAYLFTGPRGTGKTSTARILAKAVNCVDGPTPEPCQQCDACVAITEGSSVDVIELDMASHGGVDDARDLRERALFAPAGSRRKVYILDEVHMASPAAFNALLKLIEEPPGHVMFAMATTDPQKVLPTIMSRVQRLDLRRVGAQDLVEHIERIAALEGVELEAGAVEAIVRAGDGSVRDTLSIFEQVQSFADEHVTSEDVAQVLGITPAERTFEAVGLLAGRDVAGVLGLVQDLLDDGHDLRRFALDLVEHLRDLLVLQVAPERTDLVEGTAEWRQRVTGQAGLLPKETLLRAVDVLADTVAEMRRGRARLPLELALARIATPETTGDLAALADRVARIEAATSESAASATDTEVPAPAPVGSDAGSDAGREAARRTAQALSAPADEDADADEDEVAGTEAADAQSAVDAPAQDDQDQDVPEQDVPEQDDQEQDDPGQDDPGQDDQEQDAPEQATAASGESDGTAGPPAQETVEVAAPSESDVTLDEVLASWSRVLDVLRERSVRLHAIVQAGTPVRLRGNSLTLAFAQQFHAEETAKTSHKQLVTASVDKVLGIAPTIRTEVGDADPAGDDDGRDREETSVDRDEEIAVREAESVDDADSDDEAADRAEQLLRNELGAEPLDEA